jgi:anti-anti-sigma factor
VTDLARVEASTVNSTTIVRVSGEIDLSNTAQVRDAIGAAVPDAAAVIVLDLSETAYLDSAGIAMIFRLAERLRYNRQELRLVVPPDAPIRVVVRLTKAGPGHPDPGRHRLTDGVRRRGTRGTTHV